MGLPFHSMILVLVLTGCFLQQAIYESPCDGVDGAVKRQVAKRSLQRSLNNQTSHYKTMLDLCENEMMSINFFLEFIRRARFMLCSLKIIIENKSTPSTTSTGRTYKINDKYYRKLFLHVSDVSNNKLLYIVILQLPFEKCFISVNKCLITKAKTWQYSHFWLPNL